MAEIFPTIIILGKNIQTYQYEQPSSKLDGFLTESSLSCLFHPSCKQDSFRKRVDKSQLTKPRLDYLKNESFALFVKSTFPVSLILYNQFYHLISMSKKNNLTKRLLKEVWGKKFYYDQARESVLKAFSSHNEFLLKLKNYVQNADTVLECGCGCASVIEGIWQKDKAYFGVDVSSFAIKLAKKRLKGKRNIKLCVENIEKLAFGDNFFDLVYAVSVLEHLINPEKALKEMIRVTKKGGYLILMSPNFGSPFFPSFCYPKSIGARLKRLIKIMIKSHFYLLREPKTLDWNKVYPLVLKEKEYLSDWDTVVEPYLQTLLIFLRKNRLEILENHSTLQALADRVPHELPSRSRLSWMVQFIFRNISLWVEKVGLPPYCYFGPSLFVAAKKG